MPTDSVRAAFPAGNRGHQLPNWQRPNGPRSRRAGPLQLICRRMGDFFEKTRHFSPNRHFLNVDRSCVHGSLQRHPLQQGPRTMKCWRRSVSGTSGQPLRRSSPVRRTVFPSFPRGRSDRHGRRAASTGPKATRKPTFSFRFPGG